MSTVYAQVPLRLEASIVSNPPVDSNTGLAPKAYRGQTVAVQVGIFDPSNVAVDLTNLASLTLVAGQPFTMITEPFVPEVNPGNDVGQRIMPRRVARFTVNVRHATGFLMARLFSGKVTRYSPALGSVVNARRFPAYYMDDDTTAPPPTRETMERIRPMGRTFDPRVAIIRDVPGPMIINEIGLEVTI